jgi:hypothetical protein
MSNPSIALLLFLFFMMSGIDIWKKVAEWFKGGTVLWAQLQTI